jgi:hypothetical protein
MPPVPVPPGGGTLAQTYAAGAAPGDQTMTLLDAKGGTITIDATQALFTMPLALGIANPNMGSAVFPRVGGIAIVSNISAPSAPGLDWNEIDFSAISTFTLTGAPGAVTTLARMNLSQSTIDGAGNTIADAYNLLVGAAPIGTATITRSWSFASVGNARFDAKVAIDVVAPTALLHLGAGTAVAGTAPLKIVPGVLLGAFESGAIESDGTHLYWTNGTPARVQLDNTVAQTLAATYAFGAGAADQTMILTNARGGAIIVNGTTPGPAFTGVTIFELLAQGGSINFYSRGGFDTFSTMSVPAAVGATWDEVAFLTSTITLTGAPANETLLAQVHVGAGIVNGAGNTVSDAYNFLVDAAPAGTASITRSWSLGAVGNVQLQAQTAMGGAALTATNTLAVLATKSAGAAIGLKWYGTDFVDSTLTLTGAPAPTINLIAMVRVGSGNITGPTGNTILDAYDLYADSPPATGTEIITRAWSIGAAGAVQFRGGIAMGGSILPPNENDIAFGAGAVGLSEANTGRLGYLAGGTQAFMVSMNGGAYVPLLVGPAAGGFTPGSVPFGSATGALAQDNASFFWHAANATLQLNGAAANATSTLAISTAKTLAAPAAGSVWNALQVEAGTLTATMGAGSVTITKLAATRHYQPTITTAGGAGLLTVSDAYTMYIDAPPVGAGSATLTNTWSLGVVGGVQLLSKLYIAPAAVSSGTFTGFTQIAAAHTNLTAGTEIPDTNFNLSATKTWATGAIATQRDFIVQARTYAFAAASTVTTAATFAITGAPALGANASITTPLAFWVQSGNSLFSGNVGLAINPTATGRLTIKSAATNSSPILIRNSTAGNQALFTVNEDGTSNCTVNIFDASGAIRVSFPTSTSGPCYILPPLSVSSSGTPDGRFAVVGTQTITAAAGAKWNAINFGTTSLDTTTLTISGATTPITTLNFVAILGPAITAASAVVTSDFFTVRIGAATFIGVGPASATRNWSLGIDGNTKFGGGQTIHGTDINVAGPYAILATDYYLHVRRTATAAISLNLPSIAIVGDGFVIQAKDAGYNAAVNPITWIRNGADTIENVAGNYTQNVLGSLIKFVANATTNNWELS